MFARRIAVTSAAQAVQLVLNGLGLILLARLLAPADLGLYLILAATIALIGVALTAGPQASLLVSGAKGPSAGAHLHGQALALSLACGITAGVAATLLAVPVAEMLSSGLPPALVVLTLWRLAPTVYGGLLNAALMGAGHISQMAFLNVTTAASALGAPLGAFLVPSDPLLGSVAGALGGSVAFAAIALVVGWRSFGLAVPTGWDLWRDMGRLALPVHLGTVAYWIMLRADLYVVNALLAGPAVGIYGFALSVSERVSVIAAPIYGATASHVSGVEREVAASTTAALVRAHVWIAGVLFAAALVGGGWFLEVLGGAEYRAGAVPFAILLLGSAILPIWSIVGLYMISQQHAAWTTTVIQFGAALLAMVLYFGLIPSLEITGAAIGSAVAYGMLTLGGILFLVRRGAVSASQLVPRVGDVKTVWSLLRRYATGA